MKPYKRKDIAEKQVGAERIVHDPVSDTMHVLDEHATMLWDNLDGSRTVSELVETMIHARAFEDPEFVRMETRDTLATMAEKDLIEPKSFCLSKADAFEHMEREPTNPVPCIRLGIAYLAESQYERARECFELALARDPSSASARINVATLAFLEGRFDEAESRLRACLDDHPDHPEALNNLGNLAARRGDFAEARAFYERALAVKADYPDAWNNLGRLHQQADRMDDAVNCYEHALNHDPANSGALIALRDVHRVAPCADRLIHVLERACAAAPTNLAYYDDLAGLYLAAGRMEEARKVYQSALKHDAEPNWFLYSHLARVRQMTR
ncbi:MAG TPA: PqqD family peptide modification chaperone [Kiritimatiellia bacterium]|nr:PqqD family peptide modification chaperone [Kiritimatiellia bacterium]HMO98991.1 PqqD family peptide modification chaperone [Kiritimatiellia bacterium]HMP95878.1 PqqD family peptide modification chaperone [Kiritimatiellia bacterium]